MTKVYLLKNSNTLQNAYNYLDIKENENIKQEKAILSCTGEETAKNISQNKIFQKLDNIYSSNFISAISTAKYIAKENNIKINITTKLNERKNGDLETTTIKEYNYNSMHNFDYKLKNGESLNDTKKRISAYLKDILFQEDDKVLIVSHELAIISLLTNWCEIGYNYEDNLILTYKDQVIYDNKFNCNEVYILTFDGMNLQNIEKEILL